MNLPTRELHDILNGAGHHSMEFLSLHLPPKTDDIYYIDTYDNSPKGAIMSHGDNIYHYFFTEASGTQRLAPRGYYEDHIFGETDENIELQASRMDHQAYFGYDSVNAMKDLYVSNGWQYIIDNYITGYEDRQPTIDRIERDVKARNGEVVS
jgi:hypothetical protein